MKNKVIIILALFINISYICLAQPQNGRGGKAEAVLTEFLTKELNLSPDETQRLKPVYRNYVVDIRQARKDIESDPIATEERILNTRKKYREEFKKILGSDERVNKLLLAEKHFREILRKELIQRRLNKEGS
jgi:hypothetical protein